jgi:hypothetical protein
MTTAIFKLCQETIWLDADGRRSTYCMRAAGHQGKHNPAGNFEPAGTLTLTVPASVAATPDR